MGIVATWSTAYVNDLPDSAFLHVESGGEKDSEGKTTPRSLRHFPVKDQDGKVDLPHLRDALSRIPQSKLPQGVKNAAAAKARKMLKGAGGEKAATAIRPRVLVARRGGSGPAMLAAALPGKAPPEFQIFAPGINETDYGDFAFDSVSAAMVMQAYESDNKGPLKFDYNHGMTVPGATAEQGKMAGTFVPEVRDGALWATKCDWTPEAQQRFEDGEYDNYSPYFFWDWSDGDDAPRITKLVNCALVNLPGLHNMRSIAAGAIAASATPPAGEPTMDEIETLREDLARANREIAALKAQHGTAALAGALGLSGAVTPDQAVTAAAGLSRFRGEVLGIAGASDQAAALGTITSWRDKAARADQVIAEAAAREETELKAAFDAEVETGVRELKLEAAKDGALRTLVVDAALGQGGGKPSRQGVAYLKARITGLPRLVGASGARPPAQGLAPTALDTDLSRRMNFSADDEVKFQEWRAQQAAAGQAT